MRDFSKPNYKQANIQTRVAVFVMTLTGARFQKSSRGSTLRKMFKAAGMNPIDLNWRCPE